MADRGFSISNDVAPFGITLNIPAFLSGMEQFATSEVIESQTIASVRIHIERAIQRVKRFRILRSKSFSTWLYKPDMNHCLSPNQPFAPTHSNWTSREMH